MARVTVEDCVVQVPNRFDLVVLAAQRARQIYSGAPLTIDRGDDKFPVLSLREIAGNNVNPTDLRLALIKNLRTQVVLDETEQQMANALSQEKAGSARDIEIGRGSVEEKVVAEPEEAKDEQALAEEFEAEMAKEVEAESEVETKAEPKAEAAAE